MKATLRLRLNAKIIFLYQFFTLPFNYNYANPCQNYMIRRNDDGAGGGSYFVIGCSLTRVVTGY